MARHFHHHLARYNSTLLSGDCHHYFRLQIIGDASRSCFHIFHRFIWYDYIKIYVGKMRVILTDATVAISSATSAISVWEKSNCRVYASFAITRYS